MSRAASVRKAEARRMRASEKRVLVMDSPSPYTQSPSLDVVLPDSQPQSIWLRPPPNDPILCDLCRTVTTFRRQRTYRTAIGCCSNALIGGRKPRFCVVTPREDYFCGA